MMVNKYDKKNIEEKIEDITKKSLDKYGIKIIKTKKPTFWWV